jgi:transcription-repair coupling factor (superfamily II helicase)
VTAPLPDISLLTLVARSAAFTAAVEALPVAGAPVRLRGLHGALRGLFAAALYQRHGRQCVLIAADGESALELWNDAGLPLADGDALFVGDRRPGLSGTLRGREDAFAENADTLRELAERPDRIVVTDIATLLAPVPSAAQVREHTVAIARGDALAQGAFIRNIAFGGFEQRDFVSGTGEYAVRGGIVDVFPAGFDNPLRVEFFGDEIDSIREFDSLSQRSIRSYDDVRFVASLFLQDDVQTGHTGTLAEFFAPDAVVLLADEERARQAATERGGGAELEALLARHASMLYGVLDEAGLTVVDAGGESQPAFNSSVRLLLEHLAGLTERGVECLLVADSPQQAQRLDDLLRSSVSDAEEDTTPVMLPPPVRHCPLSAGFALPDARLAVFTEHQVFNRRHVRKRAAKGARGISLREMRQLQVGDYVVHTDKGIGRFAGFETIRVGGGLQETAKLVYADEDTLYVNLSYLHKLQKYSSQEGHSPHLSKLGSGVWEKTKARTKARLKDIARDLIRLYAQRKLSEGHAFPPDTAWQREMEASFMYEDTPDQATATADVKRDMEASEPMDRLVCGDVGYGKTEVAVRAAFKAVLDGRQVAVLVPTTILAQQHMNTFRDRLHRYSVEVEALSRFRSKQEQQAIIERLAHGRVDVVIGTHRLLSADVRFRDLGLLIIDEEHRFGVSAKEKLRQFRANVDTLTMTATPIPRTLNFSLLGARDLSVIETPPKNRLPIVTSIIPFSRDTVMEGIGRELERGGQVFFVNDRIGDIDLLADTIRSWLPGVRVAVAHGRMTGAELERVMLRFMERKIDVLVATKIVESGLDIPNANTIFINRAAGYGLAELYQLRGRVGRSNTQAYAYLLVEPEGSFSRDALKRLQAIQEFSELGAGFQLSMRDLEIRGAGNMLGAEQSGYIEDIGFDLYMNTLEEAVQELKREEFAELFREEAAPARVPRPDVVVEVGLDAYLPQDFVRSATERFDLYKRLYNCTDEEGIAEIERELFDRFSLLPAEAENLFAVVRVRLSAARIRLSRVALERGRLQLTFPPEDDAAFWELHLQPLMHWVQVNSAHVSLAQDRHQMRMDVRDVDSLDAVRAVLADLLASIGQP